MCSSWENGVHKPGKRRAQTGMPDGRLILRLPREALPDAEGKRRTAAGQEEEIHRLPPAPPRCCRTGGASIRPEGNNCRIREKRPMTTRHADGHNMHIPLPPAAPTRPRLPNGTDCRRHVSHPYRAPRQQPTDSGSRAGDGYSGATRLPAACPSTARPSRR